MALKMASDDAAERDFILDLFGETGFFAVLFRSSGAYRQHPRKEKSSENCSLRYIRDGVSDL